MEIKKHIFANSSKNQPLTLQVTIVVGTITIITGILSSFLEHVRLPSQALITPAPCTLSATNNPQIPIYSTDNTSIYYSDHYAIYNNMWNMVDAGTKTYFQHMDVYEAHPNNVNAQWFWSWPEGSGVVKAFPSIIFGQSPIPGMQSTTSLLPVQLSNLGGFVASYDITVSAAQNSSYNTAFDIWITSDNPPTLAGRTAEVMIWINHQTMQIPSVDERVTIDGHEYDYTIYQDGHLVAVFQKVNQESVGSVSLDHFLNYLLDHGYLSASNFLADIEFGNEIGFGSGHTSIRSYSVRTTD